MTESFLDRRGAAGYLTEKLGRRVTLAALHRHASDGTGPRYVIVLGRASYRREWLDAWVESLVEEPKPRIPLTRRRAKSREPAAAVA